MLSLIYENVFLCFSLHTPLEAMSKVLVKISSLSVGFASSKLLLFVLIYAFQRRGFPKKNW